MTMSVIGSLGTAIRATVVITFFLNPFTDIGRAILELHAIRFAASQELHSFSIYEGYVVQIQNHPVLYVFQIEQSSQLFDIFQLDPTAQNKNAFCVCFPLDS
jgi:hypothetical protein